MLFACSGPLELDRLKPADINIEDIAQGLSQINRFNGQTRQPIPVLWHSMLVTNVVAYDTEHGNDLLLEALFHDAAEAYVGDWIQALDRTLGSRLTKLRDRIQATCFAAAGLHKTNDALSPEVALADNVALRFEIGSRWGYDQWPDWQTPLGEYEAVIAHRAQERIGDPPDDAASRRETRELFLAMADRILPAEAPIRVGMPAR